MKGSRKLLAWTPVWSLAVLLLMPDLLRAQATSTIQGQITDASGAAVVSATVKATNEGTGFSRTAQSAGDGYYRIPDLLPGSYQIRVESPGFKTFIRSNLVVTAEAIVGLNVALEVGEVTQTVTITAEEPQVETQVTRISEVLPEEEVRSLPLQGRGVLNLSILTPGIVGKPEPSGVYCCDVFSNFGAPRISAGGNEQKGQWFVDGISLRYSEGSGWGAAFSPNPDAVTEIRVSTNPTSADMGRISGPQIQIVTKGGTNDWHGTGHYTFQNHELNARPFFSESVPDSYYRLFGGTFGGPIIKDRLFAFGAYEGLRSLVAGGYTETVETQQFRDLVLQLRPNSIAATVLQAVPPLRYPTTGVDVGTLLPGGGSSTAPDGIPDIGQISVDSPFRRWGNQFNGRVDYQFPNDKDRLFAAYWYTKPQWGSNVTRPASTIDTSTKVQALNVVHTRSFTPNVLNEARFGVNDIFFDQRYPKMPLNIPYLFSDDGGISINASFNNIYHSRVYQFADNFSINRGRHAFKFGVDYRYSLLTAEWPYPPSFSFHSILDFANDSPYAESRTIDVASGGEAKLAHLPMYTGDFSVFFQNTWQMRPNLTLNYGLRMETFTPTILKGEENYEPVLTSSQVTSPTAIAQVKNQRVDQLYGRTFNFGPRLGLAWDPTKKGKMSVRFAFGVLYDEVNTYTLYGIDSNPPSVANVSAGTELGIPVVYQLAPEGTQDFPVNPNLQAPKLTPSGGIEGARVGLTGIVTDLQSPLILDFLGGVQYQLANDVMVQANYTYRRGARELYSLRDINRFQGDLLDGLKDGFNSEFSSINMLTNRGRRIYHGIVTNITKRFSQGYSISASYTYNYGKNNFNRVEPGKSDFYYGNETDAFNQQLDYARDDFAHVFTIHSLWELPFLRGRSDWTGRILGGWQLNTIWSLQSGELFVPVSTASFSNDPLNPNRGDFNADGYRYDRPDKPTQNVASSFSNSDWLRGALSASLFPLPDPSSARPGTLPRDMFRGPGYANVDVALVKQFGVWKERGKLQVRLEAFNIFNRLNISSVENEINRSNFGFATGGYQNRVVQMSVKFLF